MKQTYLKVAGVAMMALFGMNALAVNSIFPAYEFQGEKLSKTTTAAFGRANHNGPHKLVAKGTTPENSYANIRDYGYLAMPDGETWFYTTDYEYDKIVHNEYYTEYYMKGYTFTIYDMGFNYVGTISDKLYIDTDAGETGCRHALLNENVTKNFFNGDDKLEFIVYLGMNTGPANDYKMHFYNKVYSLDGNKTDEGYDECVAVMEGRIGDVLNAATDENENFIFSVVQDVYPPSKAGSPEFPTQTDWAKNVKTRVTTYGKAVDEKGYVQLDQRDILNVCMPGDTTDGIYLITKMVEGKPYFIYSYYEKPYLVDPVGGALDESATPDNNFLIDTFTLENGAFKQTSATVIPVEMPDATDQIYYVFYNLGAVSWKNDVDMAVNGKPGEAAYIITRRVTTAANLEDESVNLEIYGNDGKFLRNLGIDAQNVFMLNSEGAAEPQAMMIRRGGDDEMYHYDIVNLYSGNVALSVPQIYNGEGLMVPAERVRGLDGNFKYVFEIREETVASNGNQYKRMIWFNTDGTVDHIDRLNMGTGVQASQVNMDPNCLNPHLFDDDDAMEYAVLVKRSQPNGTTRNEFIVVDDSGDWYAKFSADDGKGDPSLFSIFPGKTNRLHMTYENYTKDNGTEYNLDIYALPFLEMISGIGSVTDEELLNVTVTYDGTAVYANGAHIEIYGTNGVKLAEGNDAVSVADLSTGVYVAVVRDAQGKKAALKIAK